VASRGDRQLAEEARKDALDAFLAARIEEGWRVESRTPVQAIIVSPQGPLSRFRKPSKDHTRQVIVVDEHGEVTTTPAQPLRS
jgi:hypothetical protein